jgi:limonene-1,2-epoxide hydrolase
LALLAALALALVALAVGCGGGTAGTPETIVREWSDALNAGDNERAADLFARGAQVVQGNNIVLLQTHADAVVFNSSLPCSGKIVDVTTDNDTATATFVLGDRKASHCDAPGQKAVAAFKVVRGKIVLWHQLPTRATPPATPV